MIGRFKEPLSTAGEAFAEGMEYAAVVDSAVPSRVLPLSSVEDEYYSWLLGVNSSLSVPLGNFELQVLDGINEALTSVETVCASLPRLPDVLPKLMRALRDERASWEEIANIVGQDALLVVEVLHLANSPCFRASSKITCLEQVVMQLGVVGLREVVITVSLKPIMKFEGSHYYRHAGRKIWSQALAAAVACRSLAAEVPGARFEAYLAGLVHNVGMVVVMQTLQRLSRGGETPRSMAFREQVLPLMKRLSFLIARQWQLPEATLQALEDQLGADGSHASPLGGILQRGIWLGMLHTRVREGCGEGVEAYLLSLPEEQRRAAEQAMAEIGGGANPG